MKRLLIAVVVAIAAFLPGLAVLNSIPDPPKIIEAHIIDVASAETSSCVFTFWAIEVPSWGGLYAEGKASCASGKGTRKFTASICTNRGCKGSGYHYEEHSGPVYYAAAHCYQQVSGPYWTWVQLRVTDGPFGTSKTRTGVGSYQQGAC
jgi:hypothetical protein